jgi:multisubunit Na+/H+ antiporter MnhB subunit
MNPIENLLSMLLPLFNSKKIHWLVPIATGAIAVCAAVALLYVLPPYIISILNQTALFTAAQVAAATAAVTTVTAICFLVMVIGLLWVVIGIVSSQKGGGK